MACKVINLFGGPGTGKSTTASDLFALMKWNNYNVEIVNEYAKELTWEKRNLILDDQLYVTAKQNSKLWRIKDQVDWAITDSPLILGQAYARENYLPNNFCNLLHELYNTYDNINILLKREKPFHSVGRNQTEDEAIKLDIKIKEILDVNQYPYIEVAGNQEARSVIFEYIKQLSIESF